MLEILTRNKNYPDSIIFIENRVKNITAEIKKEYKKNITFFASYINRDSPEYNHDILFVADTQEELLNMIFRKTDSLKYCNGTSVEIGNKMQKIFHDYFYNHKDGISNYYKAGGDMW